MWLFAQAWGQGATVVPVSFCYNLAPMHYHTKT